MIGVVEAVGEGVTAFKVGDEVYGLIGGFRGLAGSHADYAAVDVDLIVVLKSSKLTLPEAAAIPQVFLTAWEGLVDRARVQAGQSVLVQGGAGGVRHMANQIAKAHGAPSVRQGLSGYYGANPMDYHSSAVDQYVAEHANGIGFNLVYDTIDGSRLYDSMVAARPYGHVLSCLAFANHNLSPSLTTLHDTVGDFCPVVYAEWEWAGSSRRHLSPCHRLQRMES